MCAMLVNGDRLEGNVSSEPIDPPIVATYPRRHARLVGYISSILAGVAYIVFPPITSFYSYDAAWPAIGWGVLFILGGFVSIRAWYTRELLLDRIGLSLIIIGGFGMFIHQSYQSIVSVSWTRLGYAGSILLLLSFLVSRWQDVLHDERMADKAVEETNDI